MLSSSPREELRTFSCIPTRQSLEAPISIRLSNITPSSQNLEEIRTLLDISLMLQKGAKKKVDFWPTFYRCRPKRRGPAHPHSKRKKKWGCPKGQSKISFDAHDVSMLLSTRRHPKSCGEGFFLVVFVKRTVRCFTN